MKKKKRRELIIRSLLIILIIVITVYSYWWYNTKYLTANTGGQLYTITIDEVSFVEFDALKTPYIEFNVHFQSEDPDFDIASQDFSGDIKVLSDYNYKVTKSQGGVYTVKVTFEEDNIPDFIQVQVKDNIYTVSVVKDVTISVLSAKIPTKVVLGDTFTTILMIKTPMKIDDWKVASNLDMVGGKVSETQGEDGFIYTFTLNIKADKITDALLVKVYSNKHQVSKTVRMKISVIEEQTSVDFNLKSDQLMVDPEKEVSTEFTYVITTNYHDTFTIEYTSSEYLSVDVENPIKITPGDNVIQGIIYLKKDVNEVRKEAITLVLRDSNGKIIDKRTLIITILPSLSRIRVSLTSYGLTIENMIKMSLDFYTDLKDINAEITSCSATTSGGEELDCNYDENLIELEENKITQTFIYIDTTHLVESQWVGIIEATINVAFYSQGIKFKKGITIQTEIEIGGQQHA